MTTYAGDTTHELTAILRPLSVVLGVGLDARLGDLLLPPSWRHEYIGAEGTWVYAGGRVARAPARSWGLAAAVVLAAEMSEAAEPGAYVRAIQERAWCMQDAGTTHRHPYVFSPEAPAAIELSLRAVASVLLAGGWVLDLGVEP